MNSAYHIEYLCDDLIGNQRVYDDNFLFATHVIERLLENRNVDLLAVAPYSNFTTTIHKLESLIGFNSASFKTICAHEDLFERFLFAFASMVKWKFVQDTHYFRETAYAYFLSSYLDNFLPTTDQKLTSVKNSDWFVVNPNSSAVVNSPLKLLRPEVIESSFASEFTYVPTFRNLYPKLYQFINHLIRFLTTLDTWPNVMQLVTLKHIMEHYYKFLVSETNDRDFMSFKLRLRNKPPFFHWLHDFLRRMLEDWPTDWSYITIVELWQLLVCPQNLFQDENKLRQFMSSSSSTYIDLIDIIIIRVIEADMLSPSLGPFMDYLIEEMFSEANVRLLEKFEVPMCDYLLIVREKIQVTYENEKAKSVLQTQTKLSLLERIFSYLRSFDLPSSQYNLSRLEKYLNATTNRINSLSIPGDSMLNVSKSYNISLITSQDSPRTPTKIPDHAVDRRTKLFHLTPPGRAQVINRQAKFDFKSCSKEISLLYPAKQWWQNAGLLKICHNLSVRYNNSRFGRYLRYNRLDTLPARLLSKLFLRQALAPRNVPVFSKTISRSYYCLDLSIFANYFVIISVVWLSLSLFAHLIDVLV